MTASPQHLRKMNPAGYFEGAVQEGTDLEEISQKTIKAAQVRDNEGLGQSVDSDNEK